MNTPWSQQAAKAIELADLLSQRGFPVMGVYTDSMRAKMWSDTAGQIARAFAAEVGAAVMPDRISYPIKRQDFLFHHNGVDVRWDEPVTVTVSEQVPA